ncbi:MAG: glycoside hydrolase family 15 protein [Cyclobacteriaceae bacterium]|nr:glycoside hydrolase family 15 protein [Cyclobacteriaceae bacterium]
MENRHTYDLGLIGNCAFQALIDTDANVQWLCWPRFDSSFVFGGLLDKEKGGEFSIKPKQKVKSTCQEYIKNTNVLTTEISTKDGRYKVTDFAPRFEQYERHYRPLMLIRKVEPMESTPEIKVVCDPRGEYGQIVPEVVFGSSHLRYMGLEEPVRLTTNLSLNYLHNGKSFKLSEPIYLILTWGVPLEGPVKQTAETFLTKTIDYWHDWVRHCTIGTLWQESVIRSALTLKMHQFEDTGAITASTTTSLPEHPGAGRNWDYRYCWMRDSYYTLAALNSIGHFEELEKYTNYIENIAIGENLRYNPVYNLLGNEDFEEQTLDLKGYMGNTPVRIGNQAKEHIQNDVYGQILVSLLPLYTDERLNANGRKRSKKLIMDLLKGIERTMDEPDAGLWELRNMSFRHCYTFQFHWAGANAAIKIAHNLEDDEMLKKARYLEKEASKQIEKCYKDELKAYTSAIETDRLDASQLHLITMGYLDPTSDRAKNHLEALEKELKTEEGLFYRYKHEDDFGKPKSTFLICAYWYVEALACVGRVEEAQQIFEYLLSFTNHLGLHSEDIDEITGSQWGNFPQTYSHVGLINAAFRINRKLDRPNFLSFS